MKCSGTEIIKRGSIEFSYFYNVTICISDTLQTTNFKAIYVLFLAIFRSLNFRGSRNGAGNSLLQRLRATLSACNKTVRWHYHLFIFLTCQFVLEITRQRPLSSAEGHEGDMAWKCSREKTERKLNTRNDLFENVILNFLRTSFVVRSKLRQRCAKYKASC